VRAPPDGYTLLVVDSSPAINATYYNKLNFDFIRDIAPVAGITSQPETMEVNPSVPAKTAPEFIAYAKARLAISLAEGRHAVGGGGASEKGCEPDQAVCVCEVKRSMEGR
jgi:tripartite-type tricarboxylate transporter receptor subunit TctC